MHAGTAGLVRELYPVRSRAGEKGACLFHIETNSAVEVSKRKVDSE